MTDTSYQNGLEGVIAAETTVSSHEDGLRYRGYAINALADHAMFEEVAYLILNGELPNVSALKGFHQQLVHNLQIDPEILDIVRRIPNSASPTDVMRTGASLLAHWDYETSDNSCEANQRKCARLLAGLPVIMAARHRLLHGQSPLPPMNDLSLAGNILWMLNGETPAEDHVHALDVSLILSAEDELAASTFAARVVTSTLSDLHSSITAGIGAQKGALQGGANASVLDALSNAGSPECAEAWVRNALDQKQRIMGFGHPVDETGDPRAQYLKPLCALLAISPEYQQLEATADVIERTVVATTDLRPNLDWPSARLFHYLGIPAELYTPLIIVGRVVGWSAHVIEQLQNNRIVRPRLRYTGPAARDWLAIESRK